MLALTGLSASGARHLPKDTTRCMGLKPTKSGTARGETLRGTSRRDVIQAGGGNDTVIGLAGNDVICGGAGDDVILGGAGDDRLSGQTGADRIDGRDGDDTAAGGPGSDTLTGGAGADALGGGRGSDSVDGGDGDDRVYGGPGHDMLSPGSGTDRIYGGPGADDVLPGDGPSTIVPDPVDGESDPGDPALAPGADVVVPDESAEPLLGRDSDPTDIVPPGSWNDSVDPGGGDDTVMPSPGGDTVKASAGDDHIEGGAGDDNLDGGDGRDTVDGGPGDDRVDGGDGDDPALAGGDGQDTVLGGPGDDHANGGPQRDSVNGGPGSDAVDGGDGGDVVTGGPDDGSDGADTVTGGPSFDKLLGGAGDDTLDGGADSDALFGESGADRMTGGTGYDDGYGEKDGSDICTDVENPAFCVQTGTADNSPPAQDAPAPTGGACDAWASNAGDDAAPGTAAAPFHTVERLANSLRAGETGCLVGGETYEEPDFEIHVRGAGDPGKPITVRTGPGGGSGPQPRATVKGRVWVDRLAHDVVFENLAFDGQNPLARLRGGALPSPTVNGDRISFIGDDITTSGTSTCLALGAFDSDFGEAHGTVVSGNRIHGCGVFTPPDNPSGDNGLDLQGSHDAVVSNNYIFANSDRGVLLFGDAQGSRFTDNAISGNRIDVHFGTAVFKGADIVPDDNHFTNNVIAGATLARNSGGEWEVEGNKDSPTAPDAQGNLVDSNCVWNQNPNGTIQQPQIEFTDGGHNLVEPPNGPGFADAAGGDFRLSGAPGTCPRTYGPEDPPLVDTLGPPAAGVGYSITDRSRTAGSTVWIEYRPDGGSGTDGKATAPVSVAPGATASASVPLTDLETGVLYRYRAVARSASGFVYGPERTISGPPAGPPIRRLPAPSAKTVNLSAARLGLVKAKLRGVQSFQPMPPQVQVTLGSAVDAAGGLVGVAMGGPGGIASLGASGGVFLVRQPGTPAVPTLDLSKRLRCGGRKRSHGGADTNRVAIAYARRGNRRIDVSGRFASATPSSDARFSLADLCQGTKVAVQQGTVVVRDPRGHLVKRLRAGQVLLRRGNR